MWYEVSDGSDRGSGRRHFSVRFSMSMATTSLDTSLRFIRARWRDLHAQPEACSIRGAACIH